MAASQQWASSDLLTHRISPKLCISATATAVASAGRMAMAFQSLLLKAFPSRMRVTKFVSMVTMVYLASATILSSHFHTDARVGRVTLRGSSTLMVAGLLSSRLGLITTVLSTWLSSSSDVDVADIRIGPPLSLSLLVR